MKINFNQNLVGIRGNEIRDQEGKVLTLKTIAVNALLAVLEIEKNLSGEKKLVRGELARRIYNNDDTIEITTEEIVLIKELVNKMYATEVVYIVYPLLETENVNAT
jgi:hypothetical protein